MSCTDNPVFGVDMVGVVFSAFPRELVFRGKRLDTGDWVQGFLFCVWNRAFICWGITNDAPNMIEVDPKTVGQFVGIRDEVSGARIFEGDILKVRGFSRPYVVRFHHYGFELMNGVHCIQLSQLFDTDVTYEVIGNIRDNPEMLQEEF